MTRITSFDLTPFYRNSVGLDRLFDRIVNNIDTAAANGNYPPHDVVKTGEDRYEIRIAAAGFAHEDIDVELHEGVLTVKGSRNETIKPEVEYLHRGISSRQWIRTFQLNDYIEVKNANMQDGVLTIQLERLVPETMKPKKIAIQYQST